ncbi:MAG: hypothetical protein H7175_16410 [Burkholderiales bacterium]|nr:hypothetical protein [Anaerolineae bacterium]
MKIYRSLFAALSVVLMISSVGATNNAVCPALVEVALATLNTNCGAMGVNSACYGYDNVSATFTEPMPDDFFDQPSDLAPLETLRSIRTAPLDVENNQWGVAMMKLRANIPNTLPGQSVVFVLMGDVTVENDVAPEQVAQEPDPVAVTALTGANIRNGPGTNWNLIGSVPAGTELLADGFSLDHNWLRVPHAEHFGWINRELVNSPTQIDSLPILSRDRRTPMQAFSFQTGIGEPVCGEVPNQLLVQGPHNTRIDLTVNGMDISIGSTVAFRQPAQDQMQLLVLEGAAYVGDDLIVPQGYSVTAPITAFTPILSEDSADDSSDGEDGGETDSVEWTAPRPITLDELTAFEPVENVSTDVLNYEVDVPQQPANPVDLPAVLIDIRENTEVVTADTVDPTVIDDVVVNDGSDDVRGGTTINNDDGDSKHESAGDNDSSDTTDSNDGSDSDTGETTYGNAEYSAVNPNNSSGRGTTAG